MTDARYIAAWCVKGWQDDKEPEYEQTECKSLAAAKRTASRMAKQYPDEWGEATEEVRGPYGWDEVKRFQWDSFGWREVKSY